MDAIYQFFAGGDPVEQFVRLFTGIFGQLMLRYFLFAGFAFLLFYVLLRKRWQSQKIQPSFPARSDYHREISYSIVTTLIFALFGYAIFSSWLRPFTRLYFDIGEFGVPYLFVSTALMVLLHDAYFYWTHRLMHHRLLYRTFHAVHHRSVNPSPWASFAFHPLEALVEASIILLIAFLIPAHPIAIGLFMVWMTTFNVLGHVGYEFFPPWLTRHPLGRWLNTSTAHNLHHKHYRTHFALYFRFWDVLCRTSDRDYEPTLAKVQPHSRLSPDSTTLASPPHGRARQL